MIALAKTLSYREPVSFLVSLLYRSALSYIGHCDAALDNTIAIEVKRSHNCPCHII